MSKTNHTINLFKGIACIFVVLIHAQFPGNAGVFITSMARFAVPFFILVSGYYSYSDKNDTQQAKYIKQLKKTAMLTIYTILFYLIVNFFVLDNGYRIIKHLTNVKDLILLAVFNRAAFLSTILWYLLASLYVYVIGLVILKINPNSKILSILAYILLILNVMVSYFTDLPWFYVGNFLLMTFPFFFIGREFKKKICNFKNLHIIIIFLMGIVLNTMETFFIKPMYCNIGSIIMAASALIYSLKNPNINGMISSFGGKYSMLVFIIHPAVLSILNMIVEKSNMEQSVVLIWSKPVIVVATTIVLSIITKKFIDKISNMKIRFFEEVEK